MIKDVRGWISHAGWFGAGLSTAAVGVAAFQLLAGTPLPGPQALVVSTSPPTAQPTRTPFPTRTPLPTRTPFPTRTPYPTRTPRPTPSPLARPGRTPTPALAPATPGSIDTLIPPGFISTLATAITQAAREVPTAPA